MTVTGPPPPPLPALAVPDERRGLPAPVAGRLLEPGADLGRAPRLLPVESAPLEDARDRFGHVQPAAAQRRVERHDAVPAQPQHPLGRLVAGEVVPHQQDPQRGSRSGRVKGTARPCCQASQRARVAAGSLAAAPAGSAATTAPGVSFSQPCRTAFVPRVAGRTRTWPVAGWNRVRILVVPWRTYSCGWIAGRPIGRPPPPGCGTAWNGPASSSHQTARPASGSSP